MALIKFIKVVKIKSKKVIVFFVIKISQKR